MAKPRIVIVGGGAGGLPLATLLGRKLGKGGRADIALVDANSIHIWKPRYHEVATGAIDADLDAVDYRGHARMNGYRFEPGALIDVDARQQAITLAAIEDEKGHEVLPQRQLDYDYLVLAIGSRSNDFGTPGVREHCLFMDSREQAERFREKFLNACLEANYHNRPLSLAIVGGGATGVELAAEIHHAITMLKLYGHEHLDRKQLNVHVIEAAPRILPALSERVSAAATERLQGLGVKVHTSTLVECADGAGFVTKGGERIDADLLVWAAGVKAPEFLARINGLTANRINQIEVDTNLRAKGQERIFVIGDCAACQLPNMERPLPPRAQSAQQMAHHLAKQLEQVLMFNRTPEPFVYNDHGSLVSLSRYSSVGTLMGNLKGGNFFVEGWLARVMYISLYRLHQATLYGWPRTLMLLLAGKFSRLVRPRLKLH
ncbi:MAG: NAD(P)/FAD-dependent oxidoreductase [Alcanivoracaceae bacterium]